MLSTGYPTLQPDSINLKFLEIPGFPNDYFVDFTGFPHISIYTGYLRADTDIFPGNPNHFLKIYFKLMVTVPDLCARS